MRIDDNLSWGELFPANIILELCEVFSIIYLMLAAIIA